METINYLVGDDITKVIQSALYNFYNGKVDFLGPDPKISVICKTGLAGIHQMDNSVKEMVENSGLEILSETGSTYVTPGTLCVIPFLAKVKFVIDPSLDPVDVENEEENPYINGFRRSSYTYSISEPGEEALIEVVATGKRIEQI